MSELVTVVVINSLSYTGTTWLNLVLGSHHRAFALGPPDRVYRMRDARDGSKACLVHGADCEFWPAFLHDYDPGRNFFIQLAERSGRNVIVTNNPIATGAGVELRHPDIEVKHVHLVRDGRALAASHRRRTAGASFLDSVTGFLHPSFSTFYFDPDNADILCLRYEDLIAESLPGVQRIGRFVGLDYGPEALRFWEHPQHITTGNQGTVAQVKLGQGLAVGHFEGSDFYKSRFADMKAAGTGVLEDERWRDELSARDRFVFDVFCGADNARFGYERHRFALSEIATFREELEEAVAAGTVSRDIYEAACLHFVNQPSIGGGASRDIAWRSSSMRERMNPRWVRQYGLHISPTELSKLVRIVERVGVILGIAVALMILLALMLKD